MRSAITTALLGLGAVAVTFASPSTASASWLSQLLRGLPMINNGGYYNGYPAYYGDPGYGFNPYPYGASYYAPGYAAPYYGPPVYGAPTYAAPAYSVPYRVYPNWNRGYYGGDYRHCRHDRDWDRHHKYRRH